MKEPMRRWEPRSTPLPTATASSAIRAIGAISGHAASESSARPATLRIALVHAPDGVRFAAGAASGSELMERLADYVRRRAPHTLWRPDARHVRALLARGDLEAAIDVYFDRVGSRWDPEWLVTTAIVTTAGVAQVRTGTAGVAS